MGISGASAVDDCLQNLPNNLYVGRNVLWCEHLYYALSHLAAFLPISCQTLSPLLDLWKVRITVLVGLLMILEWFFFLQKGRFSELQVVLHC